MLAFYPIIGARSSVDAEKWQAAFTRERVKLAAGERHAVDLVKRIGEERDAHLQTKLLSVAERQAQGGADVAGFNHPDQPHGLSDDSRFAALPAGRKRFHAAVFEAIKDAIGPTNPSLRLIRIIAHHIPHR